MNRLQVFDRLLENFSEAERLKEPLLFSFSGGMDSVFLLEFLEYYRRSMNDVTLLYFDHGLRPDSLKKEHAFVSRTAKEKGARYIIKKLPVSSFSACYRISFEMAGRQLRRLFLKHFSSLLNIPYVLTGHHQSDQVEMAFLKFIKGQVSGFGSMTSSQDSGLGFTYLRPLLGVSKQDIKTFIGLHSLAHCVDESNAVLDFERNRVRHEIALPASRINPRFEKSISEFVSYYQSQQQFIFDYSQSQFAMTCLKDLANGIGFELDKPSNRLPNLVIQQIVYACLIALQQRHASALSKKRRLFYSSFRILQAHVVALSNLILSKKTGSVSLPCSYVCEVEQTRLLFVKKINEASKRGLSRSYYRGAFSLASLVNCPKVIAIEELGMIVQIDACKYDRDISLRSTPSLAYLNGDFVLKNQVFSIRNRCPSDRFQPFGMTNSKKLSRYLMDKKIPRSKRETIPLFFFGNQLAWVLGCQVSERYRVRPDTAYLIRIRVKEL